MSCSNLLDALHLVELLADLLRAAQVLAPLLDLPGQIVELHQGLLPVSLGPVGKIIGCLFQSFEQFLSVLEPLLLGLLALLDQLPPQTVGRLLDLLLDHRVGGRLGLFRADRRDQHRDQHRDYGREHRQQDLPARRDREMLADVDAADAALGVVDQGLARPALAVFLRQSQRAGDPLLQPVATVDLDGRVEGPLRADHGPKPRREASHG